MRNRLSKVLASAGIASRRHAEKIINDGRVKVNGSVVSLPQHVVDSTQDIILLDNEQITLTEKKVYYLLNKPDGYICTHVRIGSKKLIYDLFPNANERLFSIGRLDRDTTGLLLVTNDGHFANRVIHPSSRIAKEYLVKVTQEVEHEHLVRLSKGTLIEKTWVKPLSVKKVRRGTIKIAVGEGKKREVRLMIENAGLSLVELKRIRIGGLHLGSIPEGTYRELSLDELESIFA